MYTTYLASMFRSIRFGITEAHGRGVAIQLNYFLDNGGVTVAQDGTFAVNPERIKQNVVDLTRDIMTMQAKGDYAAAKQMLEKLGVVRPQVQAVLDKLKGVPVDIEPRFVRPTSWYPVTRTPNPPANCTAYPPTQYDPAAPPGPPFLLPPPPSRLLPPSPRLLLFPPPPPFPFAAQSLGAGLVDRRLGGRARSRLDDPSRLGDAGREKGARDQALDECCAAAPPVLEFDPDGEPGRHSGAARRGLRVADVESRHHRRPQGQRVDRRQRRRRLAGPQVHEGRQVPAADRQADARRARKEASRPRRRQQRSGASGASRRSSSTRRPTRPISPTAT